MGVQEEQPKGKRKWRLLVSRRESSTVTIRITTLFQWDTVVLAQPSGDTDVRMVVVQQDASQQLKIAYQVAVAL